MAKRRTTNKIDKTKKSVNVCLLTYNEAENLKIIVPQIKDELNKLHVDYNIKVIDARKTTDNTEAVCKELNVEHYLQPDYGQADAMKHGISLCDKDIFLVLDADGSHNPKYIPDIYKKFTEENCDLVIGSRYVEGGVTNDKFTSQIMSHILNCVMRVVLGVKTRDISGGYRMYDAKQIKAITITSKNFEMQQEIIGRLIANNRNLKIGEVPIVFEQRINGKSTRRLLLYIWCYFKNILKVWGIVHSK